MSLLKNTKPLGSEKIDPFDVFSSEGLDHLKNLDDFSFERIRQILAEEISFDYVYLFVDNEAKKIRAILREMRLRMLRPIGSVRELNRLFYSYISLLFGLCASSTTLIISAFYGNSLPRIPSLQAA